jgi:hypothetical protein
LKKSRRSLARRAKDNGGEEHRRIGERGSPQGVIGGIYCCGKVDINGAAIVICPKIYPFCNVIICFFSPFSF